jgi:hypothetical protein
MTSSTVYECELRPDLARRICETPTGQSDDEGRIPRNKDKSQDLPGSQERDEDRCKMSKVKEICRDTRGSEEGFEDRLGKQSRAKKKLES